MNREIHEEAQAEFLAALEHYAAISPSLGERFYAEMERLMNDVCAARGGPGSYRDDRKIQSLTPLIAPKVKSLTP